ncbi:MFS transporter [Phenylobacterium sp. LjRoot225]|uniref:MFS transporter n=1 Tax=Phenylobacterium sp. LjRoot225 TaxID=3342285 RepID=UPI003ECE6898
MAAVLLVLFAFPAVDSADRKEVDTGGGRSAGAWSLWPLYILAMALTAVMFMGSTQFAFLLPQVGVTASGSIGLVMSAITLLGVVVSLLFGPIERRLGLQGSLVLGLAAVAVGMALIGLGETPVAAVGGAALMGVYVGVTVPYVHHVVTLRAAPRVRARAIGLLSAFSFVGALINPFVFAPVSDAVGVQGLFVVVGVAMAVLAAGAFALRLRTPDLAPAE